MKSFVTKNYNMSKINNPHYARLRQEEIEHWQKLKHQLQSIKSLVKAPNEEIAIGLCISRQVLMDFMSDSTPTRYDLPISRANLIALWKYVTAEKTIEQRQEQGQGRGFAKARLSEEHIAERRKWREQGCDELLEAAGFRGNSSVPESGTSFKGVERSHRIMSRLSTDWLTDDDVWRIQESFLNAISDVKSQVSSSKKSEFKISSQEKTICEWLKETYGNTNSANRDKSIGNSRNFLAAERKFFSTLNRYARLGKTSFSSLELFELYQSIIENDFLREKSEKKLRIRVIDCEFKNLNRYYLGLESNHAYTQALGEIVFAGRAVEQDLSDVGYLSNSKDDVYKDDESYGFSSIREAKITCKVGDSKQRVTWWYRSNSTHTENLLLALKRGLGHSLEVENLSERGLSSGSSGLARVSTLLKDSNNIFYQGLWVDIDILVAFTQSVVVGIEQWFDNQQFDLEKYQEIFLGISNLFQSLEKARHGLYDYRFTENQYGSHGNHVLDQTKSIRSELIKIRSILIDTKVKYNDGCFEKDLDYIEDYATLIDLRIYHIRGEVLTANKVLREHNEITNSQHRLDPSLSILFSVEQMFQSFFSGDRRFIKERSWRKDPEFEIDELKQQIHHHIKTSAGKFSQATYQALAELYGNTARLDFYFSDEDDRKLINSSIERFMAAAYFSIKTDNPHRIAHWLAQVSRSYTRLGDEEKAELFYKMAGEVINQSLSPRDYRDYRKAVMAETWLAKGEFLLMQSEILSAEDKSESSQDRLFESLEVFIDSILGACHLGFARLIADALYGIFRTTSSMSKLVSLSRFNEVRVSELTQSLNDFLRKQNKDHDGEIRNSECSVNRIIVKETSEFLDFIMKNIYANTSDIYANISEYSKDLSMKIWQRWHEESFSDDGNAKTHPIVEMIKVGKFLQQID
jgi:hypothetical protein